MFKQSDTVYESSNTMLWNSIETVYGGTLYRSRTEARYALMLDHCRIPFQYEPDGYAFEERGERYVPDFWVPEWDAFLEVKRDGFRVNSDGSSAERDKCELLMEATQKDVFLAPGSPAPLQKLWRFQVSRLGYLEVFLTDMVPLRSVMAAKNHRFDWQKTPRGHQRRTYTGSGAIGDLASSILAQTKLVRGDD